MFDQRDFVRQHDQRQHDSSERTRTRSTWSIEHPVLSGRDVPVSLEDGGSKSPANRAVRGHDDQHTNSAERPTRAVPRLCADALL